MTKRDELVATLLASVINSWPVDKTADAIEALYRPSFSETVQQQERKERIINRESPGIKAVLCALADRQPMTGYQIHDFSRRQGNTVSEHAVKSRISDIIKLGYKIKKTPKPNSRVLLYQLIDTTTDRPSHQPAPPIVS